MNTQPVVEKMNAIELQIKDYEEGMVLDAVDDDDDRLPAEKAWSLAVRHQDAQWSGDKDALAAVRRELKTAFQKAMVQIRKFTRSEWTTFTAVS